MENSLNNILKKVLIDDKISEFQGLSGSSKALVVSILHKNNPTKKINPLIVVCESFEVAEVLINDLNYFIGKEGIHFFPFWDVLPYDNFSPNKDLVAQRFQTLEALINENVKVLVTTPNGMMQRFISKDSFIKNTINLNLEFEDGNEILKNQLFFSGYNLVDMVEDRGEFCAHGNIIDVFPINLKSPIRIEFSMGGKILHIKPFNIETQLTFEKSFESLVILPGNEILFNPETIYFAKKKIPSLAKKYNSEILNHLKKSLKNCEFFPGIESISPLFYPKLETLFDYLPPKYLLVINEDENVSNRADHFFKEVFMEYEFSSQQNKLTFPPDSLFITNREFDNRIKKNAHIFLKTKTENKKIDLSVYHLNFLSNHYLRQEFEKNSETSALGNIIKLLKKWNKEKIPIILCAKNQTHADHFQQVLEDFSVETIVRNENGISKTCPWLDWIDNHSNEELLNKIPIYCANISAGFQKLDKNNQTKFILLTEEEVFGKKTRSRRLQRKQIQHLVGNLDDLREGDHVVHLDYGIGIYKGLEKIFAGGSQNEFMQIIYAREERVFVPVEKIHLVQKYVNSDFSKPKLSKLGDKSWKKIRKKVANSVENIAQELADIYAKRKFKKGFSFLPDNAEMQKFELSFKFDETADQLLAISSVKQDMESEMPMDRLVCGDVGFGKTEIAMRAAFKAVVQEKQVAILVPTTILAQQHFETFKKRFEETPFIIEAISRFRTEAEQKNILKRIHDGKIDIIIGTHRLLSKDVKFLDLRLLVVDEEQRFGVIHKEKIKSFRTNLDVLTLSATPIPRTLHMSLMGIRDLSIVNTPPADRIAIRTRLLPVNDYIIQEAVSREIRRGGQVFVVHNRVESIYEYGKFLKEILPNVRISIVHGQMREKQLEKVMLDFIEGLSDVLLSSTIIESGLDIPKANTIIINNAQNFGLSQLYQLRGRVGRSNVQAYAYLLIPPEKILTGIANERLKVLQDLNDLGAGFRVASKDLEIRGAGNLLGSEQSGQIASIGLELYTQMVNTAVKKLRQTESGLSTEEINVRLDHIDQNIPETYIKSASQRLSLYKALGTISTKEELWDFRHGIEDRFGALPQSLLNIFWNTEIRIWAQFYGVEYVEHKTDRLQIKIKDTSRLNHNELVECLSKKGSTLKYIPEKTLELYNVTSGMNSILKGLRNLERVFNLT